MGLEVLIIVNLVTSLFYLSVEVTLWSILQVALMTTLNFLLLFLHRKHKMNGIITVLLSSLSLQLWIGEPMGLVLAFFPVIFIVFGGIVDNQDRAYEINFGYRVCMGVYGAIMYSIRVFKIGFSWRECVLFVIALLIVVYFGEGYRASVERTRRSLSVETRKATHDKLTGLLTRENMNVAVENEARKIGSFSIIMMDIDNFKKINDTYGHTKGDEILVDLSKVVKSSVREGDLAFRYGGEEFLVLCPKTTVYNAHQIAERIRERFNQQEYEFDGEKKHFSVSLGVAEIRHDIFTNVPEAVKMADEALYQSKHNGKNQVTDYR